MRASWRAIGRTVFWSYERGSWPYDLMVAAILLFVLATPRRWFRDQPVMAGAGSPAIQQIHQDLRSAVYTYRINAAFVTPSGRIYSSSPQLEKQVHEFLSRSAPELQGRTFTVDVIRPVMDSSGALQSYDVKVRTVTMP
jgi:hypothetical protein